MAEVFVARYVGPQGFEKRLVIKRVLPEHGSDRRFLRLFFDEARTHVSLSHGNLVPVFDFGRVGNAYFIAMEEVRGCDLGTLLAAAAKLPEKLPPPLVAHIGIELCRGLAYVHRRGFVHRDVSPRNVLLSYDGEVKLSDFGVSLAAASEAAPGVRGTLAYMAPEQARGERADGRADLYALGMVLAEASTGRRVRVNSDDDAALAAARVGAPATCDGPLGPVIERATQTDPAARFADADAMLTMLEQTATSLGRTGAAAARELAARIAEWLPPGNETASAESEDAAPATAATAGGETYFRDRKSESFVDEVLDDAPAQSSRQRARAWMWGAAVVAAIIAAAIGGRAALSAAHRRSATDPERATVTAPVRAPAPTRTPAAPQPTPQTPTPTPAPPSPPPTPARHALSTTSAPTNAHRAPPATHKPAGSGTLSIRCTPWCIPTVDDQVRGSDGRDHRLVLPAGAHRVSVRRLDDHAERTITLGDGESKTIEFTFE